MLKRALLLALPLLAAGCRDNRASIQIQAICAPTNTCVFGETCGVQYIGFATVDVTQTGHLWLLLQVENQMPTNANATQGRTNTNDAHIDEAVVEFEGAPLPKVVYELTNFNVKAGGTAVISAEAIPSSLNAQPTLAAWVGAGTREMVSNIRLRGYLDDGSRFETGDFPVGIRVCSGCVGTCAAATCPPNSDGQLPITCM